MSRLLRRRRSRIGALVLSLAALLLAGPARALSFGLDVEFDAGFQGDFADVQVAEQGTGLLFDVSLGEALGPDADLHAFYFNLAGDVPELRIESDDAVTTAYALSVAPPVAGGAGSSFDYEVAFGSGAGPSGNGVLKSASFWIGPVDPALSLSLEALSTAPLSFASGGSIPAVAAAHVQGTSFVAGASSETVGGVVPEPRTGLLLASGLLLAASCPRARPTPGVLPGAGR